MGKKCLFISVAFFCVLSITFSLPQGAECKQPTAENPIELSLAGFLPPFHFWSKLNEAFGQKIEQESGGRVKFTYYHAATLLNPRKWHAETIAGIADIAHGNPFYEEEDFPIASSTPYFQYGGMPRLMQVIIGRHIWNQFPEYRAEYKDVKVLVHSAVGMTWYNTAKKPVRTLDDLKGITLRAIDDAAVVMLKELGANPVKMPAGEIYDSMRKGIIAGYLLPPETMQSLKLGEVARFHTKSYQSTGFSEMIIMNKDKWNSLPPDIQEIFNLASEWYTLEMDKLFNARDKEAIAWAEEKGGHEFYDLPPAERAKLFSIQAKFADEKAKALDAKGLPGTKMLQAYRTFIDPYIK